MAKILYVIDALEFGGGERCFAQIINRLSSDNKIMVACLPTGIFREKINRSGVKVKLVDMRNRFNLRVFFQLADLMKKEKIDIVNSQGARADFFARIAAKLARVSFVVSTVPMPVEGFDVNPIKKLIYIALNRFSERFVDRFIVVSDALEKTMIEKHKIEPQRVVKIYNGIEKDEFSMEEKELESKRLKIRREFRLEDDVPIVGVIGRLVWQKGFEYFIDAIPDVLKRVKKAKLLVVGEGVLKGELEIKSKQLKLEDKIIFTGFRSDIKDILASIDIFVMPSLREGLPMILLEAMAMAKPIVATNIEGIKEVLENGETGILVPPKDARALTAAIIDLLIHNDKAYQIGMAARRVVRARFGVDVMVQKVARVYEELLRQNFDQDKD
jgi:glycosyltransferase involved in cell wall biosynthesis